MLNLRRPRARHRTPSRDGSDHVDIQSFVTDHEQANWPVACRLLSCDLTPAEWEGKVLCLHGMKPCRSFQLSTVTDSEVVDINQVCLEDDNVLFEHPALNGTSGSNSVEWSSKVYPTLREVVQTCPPEALAVRVRSVLTSKFPINSSKVGEGASVSFGDEFLVDVEGLAGRTSKQTRWDSIVLSWRVTSEARTNANACAMLDAVLLPLDARLDIRLCTSLEYSTASELLQSLRVGATETVILKAFFRPRSSRDSTSAACGTNVFDRTGGRLVGVQVLGARSVRPMILATVGKTVVMLPADVRATVMVLKEENADTLQDACRALAKYIMDGETSKCLVLDQYSWLTDRRPKGKDSSPVVTEKPSKSNTQVVCHVTETQNFSQEQPAIVKRIRLQTAQLQSLQVTNSHGNKNTNADACAASGSRENDTEPTKYTTQGQQQTSSKQIFSSGKRDTSLPHQPVSQAVRVDCDRSRCQLGAASPEQWASSESCGAEIIYPYSTFSYSDAEGAPPLPAKKKTPHSPEHRLTAPPKVPPKKSPMSSRSHSSSSSIGAEPDIAATAHQYKRHTSVPAELEVLHNWEHTLPKESLQTADEDDCVYVDPNPMPVYTPIKDATPDRKPGASFSNYLQLFAPHA